MQRGHVPLAIKIREPGLGARSPPERGGRGEQPTDQTPIGLLPIGEAIIGRVEHRDHTGLNLCAVMFGDGGGPNFRQLLLGAEAVRLACPCQPTRGPATAERDSEDEQQQADQPLVHTVRIPWVTAGMSAQAHAGRRWACAEAMTCEALLGGAWWKRPSTIMPLPR